MSKTIWQLQMLTIKIDIGGMSERDESEFQKSLNKSAMSVNFVGQMDSSPVGCETY